MSGVDFLCDLFIQCTFSNDQWERDLQDLTFQVDDSLLLYSLLDAVVFLESKEINLSYLSVHIVVQNNIFFS